MEFIEIARGCPYYGFATSLDMTCEEGLCSWIRQPANVASSFALFFPVYFILRDAYKNQLTHLRSIGVCTALLAFASVFAHATHLKLFGFADFTLQYLLVLILIWINLIRIKPHLPIQQWPFALCLWSVFAALQWNFPQTTLYIYGGLVFILFFTEFLAFNANPKIQYKNYFSCACILGFGFIFFVMDYKAIICDPNNHWFQLHALWHIFSAVSIIFLALFYRQFEKVT